MGNNKFDCCSAIDSLLIEYADGDLSSQQIIEVESHLQHCGDCRRRGDTLQRSIVVALDIWQNSPRPAAANIRASAFRARRRRAIALAASLALLICATWSLGRFVAEQPDVAVQPDRRVVSRSKEKVATPENSTDDSRLEDGFDVEALISQKVRSARLAVSAQLLATQPRLEHYRIQAEKYLAKIDEPVD